MVTLIVKNSPAFPESLLPSSTNNNNNHLHHHLILRAGYLEMRQQSWNTTELFAGQFTYISPSLSITMESDDANHHSNPE
jgi:hypothetical protein